MPGFDLRFDFRRPLSLPAEPEMPGLPVVGRSVADTYRHVAQDGTTTLIFGSVHPSGGGGGKQLGDEDIDRFVQGDLERLTLYAEGNYVAIQVVPGNRTISVYRCPSGGVRCFYHREGSYLRVTSAHPSAGFATSGAFDLNLKFLTHHCAFGRLVSDETGLMGLVEVTPGVVYEFREDRLDKRRLWRPEDFAADEHSALDPAQLREAVLGAVRARVSDSECYLVSLSGGLDSSVLISALAQVADADALVAVNFRDRSDVSDERRFARDVCERFGVRLETVTLDGFGTSLNRLMTVPQDVRPTPYLLAHGFNSILREIAGSCGAKAHFTGSGGDSVFFSEKTALIAADAVRQRYPRAANRALRHVRELTGQPLRKALPTVAAYGLGLRRFDPYGSLRFEGRCLSAAALASLERPYLMSEWVKEGQSLPPGKRLHLAMLADTLHYQNVLRGPPELREINPFISQPLFERVLATPTFDLVPGGEDRGMLRSAFQGDLPQSVLSRRRKGSAGAFCSDVYAANAAILREILLDGLLVQREILDLQDLQRAMTAATAGSERAQIMLLEHACTEIWARSFQRGSPGGRSIVESELTTQSQGAD